jgi:CubicO group peptidase (beta-lactamase class C family)
MRHTAAFTYGNRGTSELHKKYPQGSVDTAEAMTGSEFVARLGELPLFYQPGTRWDYSLGLDVLGLAVEAVVKEPLGKFLNSRLFAPLGMKNTTFVLSSQQAMSFAKVLPRDPETGNPQANVSPRRQPSSIVEVAAPPIQPRATTYASLGCFRMVGIWTALASSAGGRWST